MNAKGGVSSDSELIEQLRQQLAAAQLRIEEQAAEIEQLKSEIDDVKQVQFPKKVESVAEGWRKKLAAAQLHIERMREGIEAIQDYAQEVIDRRIQEYGETFRPLQLAAMREDLAKSQRALSTQPDLSALEADRQKAAASANAARIQAQQELAECRGACARAEHEAQRARGELEAERQRVAEACAAMLENGSFPSPESQVALAANGAAKAIRAGQWKDHMK